MGAAISCKIAIHVTMVDSNWNIGMQIIWRIGRLVPFAKKPCLLFPFMSAFQYA